MKMQLNDYQGNEEQGMDEQLMNLTINDLVWILEQATTNRKLNRGGYEL